MASVPTHVSAAAPAPSALTVIEPTLNFSSLRTSTITTTGQLGTKINLDTIFANVPILEYWDLNDGVLKMDCNGRSKGTCFKDIMMKPKDAKRSFFNQATLVVRRETSPLVWKEINIKLFRNGGVQITGVRSIEMASESLHWLVAFLTEHCASETTPIFEGVPRIHKEQIQLVNTDFSIGAKVRRDMLHNVLTTRYHLNSSYVPEIYQGVKTKYFYNAERPADAPPGVCPCEKRCKGTGAGMKLGACKKITISPFQTGQVIITGARTMEQINEAYEFIKGVFRDNADTVLRKIYVQAPAPAAPTTAAGTAAPPAPVPKTKKSKTGGWIAHPCPRNVMKRGNSASSKCSSSSAASSASEVSNSVLLN
jgi:TATA-box binding protein (TBP) (component of TFIID and TFIIIB)